MVTTREWASKLDAEVAALFNHDPRLVADPYPLYRRLQEEQPVYRLGRRVLITSHAEAHAVLRDPRVHQGLAAKGGRARDASAQLDEQRRVELAEMFGFLEQRLGGSNGEHHARLRRLAQRAFTPRVVAEMEDRIQQILDELLAAVAGQDEIEFIDGVAYHLPLMAISEMLDISTGDREMLRAWSTELGYFVGADWTDETVVDRGHESVFNLRSYLTQLFADRRGKETTDLLGALLAAGDEDGEFTEDELVAMVTQFVFAGHETSTNFLGNSLVTLLGGDRRHWNQLLREPDLIDDAIDELLRFNGPTQYVEKLASEDMELCGVTIEAWDTVSVVLAAANRDPAAFDRPDEVDFERGSTGQLAFGFGPHHCLGHALARLEAKVALRTLLARFPDMRVLDDPIQWQPNHMIRGPETLHVAFG